MKIGNAHYGLFALSLAMMLPSISRAEGTQLVLPELRQGYFVGGGVGGVAVITRHDERGTMDPMLGGGFNLRIGQMLSHRFGVGLAFDLASPQDARWQESYFAFGFDFQARLAERLALRAGVGLGVVQLTDTSDPDPDAEVDGNVGTNYTVGISYDFFPWQQSGSGGWSVSPTAQVRYLPGSKLGMGMAWVGIEVAWWSGLARDRLELPIDEAYR